MDDLAQVLADAREEATPGFVYYLADARSPRHPRYVGSTANPTSREKSHRKRGYYGNPVLQQWKASVWDVGSDTLFIIIAEYATITEAREAEWRLIRRWQRRGLCDCNTQVSTARFAWNEKWARIRRPLACLSH